jgi:hypothetical protein
MEELSGPVGIALGVVGGAAIIAWIIFIRRHEAELEEKAERAMPGPLRPAHKRKAG